MKNSMKVVLAVVGGGVLQHFTPVSVQLAVVVALGVWFVVTSARDNSMH